MKFYYLILCPFWGLLNYSYATEPCQNRIKLLDGFIQDRRDEFSMETVRPKLQHGRHKRSIEHTLEENGLHINDIILTYKHNGKDVVIDLRLNDYLIPESHFISYQTENGGKIVKTFNKTEIDLCHYHGTIRGSNESRVALSTCNGINGIIFDEHTAYHIQPSSDIKIDSEHILYKHTDTNFNTRCGNVDKFRRNLFSNFISKESDESNINRKLRYKRASSSDSSLRVPFNSNEDSIYLELVVVVDNDIYRNKTMNLKKVHSYVIELVNIVNSFYVPLNIFIALTGVVVWTNQDEIQIYGDGDLTLEKFVAFRKEKLVNDHPNDNAHLLLNKPFDCGVVGIAYEGLMCTTTYSGGITTIHSELIGVVATTMAHEIGHNFGLKHDDPQYCKCDDSACIMVNSTSKFSPKHWSSCSLDQLSVSINKGATHCLKNKPTKLFGSNSCGNHFVEPGEQCDCGLAKHCVNACCNPKTCMLNSNATCATGKCCDLTTCQVRTAGYECRKAKGECDLSEYCTGKSEYCPNDVFKRDTELCGLEQAYCYKGMCRSHLDQCKLMWGPSGVPGYQCFKKNTEGKDTGNCGFNKETKSFVSCNKEDVYCGLLHCRRLIDKLQYGIQQQSIIYERQLRTNDHIINCVTAILNVGRQSRDPGLTPHGAKCGYNKMCIDQKCVSIEILRARGIGSACPKNCSGNGICNNQGNCHCSLGFAPPTCEDYGVGGSIDSGPLINIQETSRVSIIFIVGLLLIILVTAFGMIYWRQNKSLPTPSELGRKISTAPREMIEIVRRVSIAPREIARRVSTAPRELARRVSNAYTNVTTIQIARSKLRRTDSPHGLSNSREILNVDNL